MTAADLLGGAMLAAPFTAFALLYLFLGVVVALLLHRQIAAAPPQVEAPGAEVQP